MKFMNKMKRFSIGIIVIWTTMGCCLATPPSGLNSGPIASDQQTQAKDLAGKRGQQQVDLFTGSFGYSIPIAGAPARNGSEPALALAYSSGGENGWCGMGWKLDIGYIERNTKDGFPIKFSTATPPAPLNQYDDTKGFILNLFGKELKLLPTGAVNGSLVEYRPEVDADFLRCILDTSNNKWMIYDKSGNVYYFGQTSSSRVVNPKTGWSGYNATFHWALDKIDTATGDETTITYTTLPSPEAIYPYQITYNGHANINGYGASVPGQHTITFTTEDRPDHRFSYRCGFRTEKNRRLTTIVCQAGGQNVCRYQLSYASSPATGRSLLHSVTVYGSDNTTPLPVQTFTYQANPNVVSFSPTIHWNNLILAAPDNAGAEPYVTQGDGAGDTKADLIDIDGDGLPDRVVWDDRNPSPYKYQVQRNLGNGSFDTTRYAFNFTSTGGGGTASDANPIPDDLSWSTLNAPHVRMRDINGDGLPDQVADYWKHFSSIYYLTTPYANFQVMLNNGGGFATVAPWAVLDPLGNDSLNLYDGVEAGTTVQLNGTYVGLFDIDGDGLPDRVMAMYAAQMGPMTNFMVQFNTGTGFTTSKLFGPYHSQNYNGTLPSQSQPQSWAGIETQNGVTQNGIMIDINGDGLPDRVMWPMDPSNPGLRLPKASTTSFAVEYNDGYSFVAINTSTSVPGSADAWPGVNPQANAQNDFAEIRSLPYVGMFDLNGDGLPDRVMLDPTSVGTSSSRWLVYLNNGHGFDATPITVSNIDNQGQWNAGITPDWWSMEGTYAGSTITTLIDINGDGLLDRVMAAYNGTSSYFLVQTNVGPFPDLLTNINNGIGGTIGVSYKPSTAWDNRTDPTVLNSGSHMPFPQYTAATITESDGVNPPRTTSYSYAGGFFDGSRREFAGFAVVTNTDPTLRTTITYFHTGGGRNYSSLGEYQDAGNFAKRGMAYRTETYGNDSLLYKMVINQVDQTSFNGATRFFPFISQSFEYDYPGGGTPRITGSKFVYSPFAQDSLIYNLTQKVLWGEVSSGNLSTFAGFNDAVTADTQYYQYSYASIGYSTSWGTFYISDHPGATSLTSDSAGNTVIQRTQYTYNSPSGTIATKQRLICPGQYATTTYSSYNSYGLPTLITDPVGVQTAITYESTYNIYPATTTVGNSMITTTTYDVRSGLLTAATDPMSINMQNIYDVFFRLTETDKGITPGGAANALWVKKQSYPATLGVITSGNAVNYADVQINDGVGGVESRTYVDGFGRPIQTRTQGENGNYRVASTAYDTRGEAFLTTWPRFESSISFSKPNTLSNPQPASFIGYDAAGRVNLKRRRVDATFDGNGAFTSKTDSTGDTGVSPLAAEQWSYVNGTDPWWKICTDEDGKVRRYQLDAFGRNIVIQEVSGGSTYATSTLYYDLAGNLTQINNQNGENIYYGYDQAGNKVAMADPHLGQWTYQRDAAGRLRVQTDARGDVVTNSYIDPATGQQDPLGRVHEKAVFKSIADFNSGTPASTATYAYDTSSNPNYTVYKGLLFTVTDSEGSETNGYDTRGRLIKTTRHLNVNNQDYTTSYTYNDGDKVTSMGYPNSGPTVNYSYWTGGSLKQVANNLSFSGNTYYSVSAGNFDEFGHVTSFDYGNRVTTTRNYYSNSKRLQTITAGSVMTKTYQYSPGDDVLNITGTGLGSAASITYDDLHRIKTDSSLGGSSYVYDPVGNITASIEGGGSAYTYGTRRLEAVKGAFNMAYLYDLCGNMIVRHGGASGSQAMTYDAENRLKVFSQAGTTVVEYGYADNGARLWKRVNQDPVQVQVWIGKIYEEKNDSAVPPVKHTLFHIFAGDQQVCTFEPGSALAVAGGNSGLIGYYYHEDNLNSSSVLSSSSGAQTEVNVYYPFGRTQTASPQAGFQVSRRFTGQILDAETGLYYYNARYYDPELGRFIQPDTAIPDLSNPQSYNRYSYCVNNPLRYNDPDGHGYWGDVGGMFMGYYDAGAGLVVGTVTMVAHPINTVNGVATAVAHPINTGKAIANSVAADWNSGSRGQGKVVGGILLTVAMAVAPGAEAGNLSKAGEVANAGEKVDQAAAAAENVSTGSERFSGRYGDGQKAYRTNVPRDENNNPIPDPDAQGAEHTRLQFDKNDPSRIYSGTEFDAKGQPIKRTDFAARPGQPVPHEHPYNPINKSFEDKRPLTPSRN